MIEVKNLTKTFGRRVAVDDLSFSVEKGTVLGFLGPNGAGKSTTMRMITGFIPPTEGTVEVCGHDMMTDSLEARKCIGYLPESAPSYGEMTVGEFLKFMGRMRGFSGRALRDAIAGAVDKCQLEDVQNQTIDTLSKGYRQRTCFAQAILHDPPILIMDEPTDGLDPNQKQVVRDMIRQMAADKVIILSTHVLEEVNAVCNRVLIISSGKIVADSTPDQLRSQSRNFNSVTLKVQGDASPIREGLSALANVETVSELDGGRLRVIPRDKTAIVQDVYRAADQNGWPVEEIVADAGRLDDVFHDLTVTEDVLKKGA